MTDTYKDRMKCFANGFSTTTVGGQIHDVRLFFFLHSQASMTVFIPVRTAEPRERIHRAHRNIQSQLTHAVEDRHIRPFEHGFDDVNESTGSVWVGMLATEPKATSFWHEMRKR